MNYKDVIISEASVGKGSLLVTHLSGANELIKNIQTLYMKSMLIKAFFMLVLLTQFSTDGHSQTPFDPTTDDGTSGTGGTGGSGGSGGSGGGGTYTGGTSGRNDVPLDGGLSILLAAGVGYGVKRARSRSKKNNL